MFALLNVAHEERDGIEHRPIGHGKQKHGSRKPAPTGRAPGGSAAPVPSIHWLASASRLGASVCRLALASSRVQRARIPFAENKDGLRAGAWWEIGAGGSRELRQAGFGHNTIGIVRLGWLLREQDVRSAS